MRILVKLIVYILAAIGLFMVVGTVYLNFFLEPGDVVWEGTEGEIPWPIDDGDYFSEWVYFDHQVSPLDKNLPEPEEGSAVLFAEFKLDGKPVLGLQVSVLLNGDFRASNLVTDDRGVIEMPLKPGTWRVNGFVINGWNDKPKGDYLVVTGDERKIEKASGFNFPSEGKREVELRAAERTSFGTFVLTKNVSIEWPPVRDPQYVNDISSAQIAWSPHKDAVEYLLTIEEMKRNGNTTTFTTVFDTQTRDLSIPLGQIPVVEETNGEINEYAVKVNAFDENGNFVSESRMLSDNVFQLTGSRIKDTSQRKVFGASEDNRPPEYEIIMRINTVELLLKNDMLEAANELIGQLELPENDWRVDRLKGFIEAKTGNCEKAFEYFEKAKSIAGFNCIPAEYLSECGG